MKTIGVPNLFHPTVKHYHYLVTVSLHRAAKAAFVKTLFMAWWQTPNQFMITFYSLINVPLSVLLVCVVQPVYIVTYSAVNVRDL